MPFQRLFASLVATLLCATAKPVVAEQISGQLQISLTLLKRCEVVTRSDDAVVHLTGHGCEHAAYQVQDASGRAVAANAEAASLVLPSAEADGATLVIYW